MKILILRPSEAKKLRRAYRLTKNKGVADRIKAVYLLSCGKRAREITEVLMLDEERIGNYRKRYEEGGVMGLLKDNYQGRETMLSCAELEGLSAY